MKYLYFFLTILIITSCSGQKKAAQVASKTNDVIITSLDSLKKVETVKTEEKTSFSTKIDSVKNMINTETPEIKHNTNSKTFNHKTWNDLLQKHVSKEGNVNYKAFKSNRKSLTAYITLLSQKLPDENWTKENKLAYWINAYNAMTVDLILRNYPIKSIKDIKNPWKQRLWKLGNKWYNLEDIEHQILRKMNEPRIHFAIVCASYSCPKLLNEAYTASNLELQLTNATKNFLTDSKRNNITKNHLKLSKIFQWFSKDFKQDSSLIDFLNKYSEIKISNKAKTSFNDYNWSLNE
ncbi:DUF547 domain-containing protein [Thalassobellus sediminis]|uniref:DUF547 domain-containing protein n=1 Tax=Thalassobellus sediminis TaxID=3367753 RepID=UPI00379E9959